MQDKLKQNNVPVILIRHAQSLWNLENRFTGWADPPLTPAGVAEAKQAGAWLRDNGYRFDVAYSSRLLRARTTLEIMLESIGQPNLQQHHDWRLNERHYGALQGKDKAQAISEVGELQVHRWRRGYEDRAAALVHADAGHPIHDPLYRDIAPGLLPGVENLSETRARVMSFWREQAVPHIRQGERLLICAHGNTLRALTMDLAGMSIEDVEAFEIPTATPILYTFDRVAKPLEWRYLTAP